MIFRRKHKPKPQGRKFSIQRHKPPQVYLHVPVPSKTREPKATPPFGGMATSPQREALENFQTPEVSGTHPPKRFIVSSSKRRLQGNGLCFIHQTSKAIFQAPINCH